MILFSFEGNVK